MTLPKNWLENYRTGVLTPESVVNEIHTVVSDNTYGVPGIRLKGTPLSKFPADSLVIEHVEAPATFYNEVPTDPSAGPLANQFMWDRVYDMGFVEFNANALGKDVKVSYDSKGHARSVEHFRDVIEAEPIITLQSLEVSGLSDLTSLEVSGLSELTGNVGIGGAPDGNTLHVYGNGGLFDAGVAIGNNTGYKQKDIGGTIRNVLNLGSDNKIRGFHSSGGTSYTIDVAGNFNLTNGLDLGLGGAGSIKHDGTPVAGYLADGTPFYIGEINITINVGLTSGVGNHGISNAHASDRIFNVRTRVDTGSTYVGGETDQIIFVPDAFIDYWEISDTAIVITRKTTTSTRIFKCKFWYT